MALALLLRRAVLRNIPALEALIAASARRLGAEYFTSEETEAAIIHVFGVDSELVGDGSYLVAEVGERIAGCGALRTDGEADRQRKRCISARL